MVLFSFNLIINLGAAGTKSRRDYSPPQRFSISEYSRDLISGLFLIYDLTGRPTALVGYFCMVLFSLNLIINLVATGVESERASSLESTLHSRQQPWHFRRWKPLAQRPGDLGHLCIYLSTLFGYLGTFVGPLRLVRRLLCPLSCPLGFHLFYGETSSPRRK
jgi:hypothetical protein